MGQQRDRGGEAAAQRIPSSLATSAEAEKFGPTDLKLWQTFRGLVVAF
jgi:hypothetical protein